MSILPLTPNAPQIEFHEQYFPSSEMSLRRLWHDVPSSVNPRRTTVEFRLSPFNPHLKRLEVLLALTENWDSYGASTINPTAISEAKTLLETLEVDLANRPDSGAPSLVVPVADGGIQIEWQAGERFLELTVEADGAFRYLLDNGRSAGAGRFTSGRLGSGPDVVRAVREVLVSWE